MRRSRLGLRLDRQVIGVVDGGVFSPLVLIVIATTLFAPLALDRVLRRV